MSSTIRVETITIGDELLLGIRENAHLTYLGTQLAHHGLEPAANMVIRDNPEDIGLFFSQAWQRADLVITTGGLGPTTDDITRESIAEALGEELVFDPKIEISLKERFSQLGKPMPEINLRQCYRPGNAEVLENPYGTAPGLLLQKEGKMLVMLPGPAREMHPMFEKIVVPRLQTQGIFPEIDCYLQVRTAGIGESALAEKIEHLFKGKEALVVGYCAHAGMVDVRLSSLDGEVLTEEALHHLADACRDAIGEDFVCLGDRTLAEVIFQGIEISQQNFGRCRVLYWGLDLFLLHRDCGYLQSFSRRCGLLPQRRQGSNARGPRKHACSTRSGERRGRYRHGDRSLREIRSRLRTERNGVRWSRRWNSSSSRRLHLLGLFFPRRSLGEKNPASRRPGIQS